jgi:hypothetical protein
MTAMTDSPDPRPLDPILTLLRELDVDEGWKLRNQARVDLLDDHIGKPLGERLVAAGFTTQYGGHDHEKNANRNAPYFFGEYYDRPPEEVLLPNLRNCLRATSGGPMKGSHAYLGLVVSHRVVAPATPVPAHVRWGFFVERTGDREDHDTVITVLENVVRPRLPADVRARVTAFPMRLTPGAPKGGRKSLSFWGRQVEVEELSQFASAGALVDVVVADLCAMHGAMKKG